MTFNFLAVCENRELRLTGGTTDREGRVEVCMNGRWMAVCKNGWTEREAGLLCRKMGHSSFGKRIIQNNMFKPRVHVVSQELR